MLSTLSNKGVFHIDGTYKITRCKKGAKIKNTGRFSKASSALNK